MRNLLKLPTVPLLQEVNNPFPLPLLPGRELLLLLLLVNHKRFENDQIVPPRQRTTVMNKLMRSLVLGPPPDPPNPPPVAVVVKEGRGVAMGGMRRAQLRQCPKQQHDGVGVEVGREEEERKNYSRHDLQGPAKEENQQEKKAKAGQVGGGRHNQDLGQFSPLPMFEQWVL